MQKSADNQTFLCLHLNKAGFIAIDGAKLEQASFRIHTT